IGQREIDRRDEADVPGALFTHIHLPLFQREMLDDEAWQTGAGGSFLWPAPDLVQQFDEIDFTFRPDRQVRTRLRDANVGEAPGALDQGSPPQLYSQLADLE